MFKFLIILLFSCIISAASGQVKSADSVRVPKSYWVAGGLGLSSLGSISIMLGANAEIKNNILISANLIGETNQTFMSRPRHIVDLTSFNALAGKIYKQRNSLISFSAGLGLVRVDRNDLDLFSKKTEISETTVGIPLSIQAYAIGFQTIGVGLNLYGNLNTKQSTAGIHLSVALGRIATRARN